MAVNERDSRDSVPPTETLSEPDSLIDLVESAFGDGRSTLEPSTILVPPTNAATPSAAPAAVLDPTPDPVRAAGGSGRFRAQRLNPTRPWWHALLVIAFAGTTAAAGYLLVDKLARSMFGISPAEALVMTLEPPVNAVSVPIAVTPSLSPQQRLSSGNGNGSFTANSSIGGDRPSVGPLAGASVLGDSAIEPPTQLAAYEAPEDTQGLFDRVRLISWKETSEGAMVTIWGNGPARADDIVVFRIEGELPRELVKLRGVDLAFPRPTMEPDVPEVSRIRTGFHPRPVANELHIVFDLTAPDIHLERVQTEGSRIHLFLNHG